MSGFKVDAKALDQYAELLSRYADDGQSVSDYIVQYGDPENITHYAPHASWAGAPGYVVDDALEQGVFALLIGKHVDFCHEAQLRAHYLNEGGYQCAEGVSQAAKFYRDTDNASAARLDATYPDAKRPALGGAGHSSRAHGFADVHNPESLLTTPNGEDLKPKADGIQTWVDNIGNWLSVTYWWREAWIQLERLFGYVLGVSNVSRDPISDVVEFFTGDWRAWAYFADSWRHCGKAVQAMGDNVVAGTRALGETWEGHAADTASAYFASFGKATYGEQKYYEYLFDTYREYLDIVYDYYQDISNLINTLIDGLATAGLDDLPKVPEIVKELYGIVSQIFGLLSQAGDAVKHQVSDTDTGAVENIYRLATTEAPPSTMKALLFDKGVADSPANIQGYHHPAG